ncbi:MAG: helix-turn-helix transcriptional regulator [Lachnospiraceae bacterium]
MESNVGKMISILRSERELTQRDLASLLNVSNGAVGMWETGKRQPDLNMILNIAKFFDVSVDYLLGIEHSKEINNLNFQIDGRQLSPDEESLLQAFNQCSEECRQYLIAKAQVLAIEGLSAATTEEYGKYIDQEKKYHPLDGIEGTGISS